MVIKDERATVYSNKYIKNKVSAGKIAVEVAQTVERSQNWGEGI